MLISKFDKSSLPSARSFYERELGQLTRADRRGWARARCPFHDSRSGKSFSVHLDSGGFFCFGCDAKGGDIVAFVRLRDACGFKAACQSLGCWRDMSADDRLAATQREQERAWNRQRQIERAEADRRNRLGLRDELHCTVKLYQRIDGELHEIGPQAESHWAALPPLLDDWRMTESAYCAAARLENPYE